MMRRMKPTTNHPWKTFEKIACDYYTGYYLFSDCHSNYVWAYREEKRSAIGSPPIHFGKYMWNVKEKKFKAR